MAGTSIWEQEERIALLRKLHSDGLSFSLIADQVSVLAGFRVTRSACIGKAHRLGLTAPRESMGPAGVLGRRLKRLPELTKNVPRPRKPGSRIRTPNLRVKAPPPKLQVVPALPAEPMPFLGLALVDLGEHHCRFPHGGDDGIAITFCGQPKVEDKSYCAFHAEICSAGAPEPKPREEKRPTRSFQIFHSVRVA